MHSGVRTKPCNYYMNGNFCPFEVLGFKYMEDLKTERPISKKIIEDGDKSNLSKIEDILENNSFSTSTPKNSDKLHFVLTIRGTP